MRAVCQEGEFPRNLPPRSQVELGNASPAKLHFASLATLIANHRTLAPVPPRRTTRGLTNIANAPVRPPTPA